MLYGLIGRYVNKVLIKKTQQYSITDRCIWSKLLEHTDVSSIIKHADTTPFTLSNIWFHRIRSRETQLIEFIDDV